MVKKIIDWMSIHYKINQPVIKGLNLEVQEISPKKREKERRTWYDSCVCFTNYGQTEVEKWKLATVENAELKDEDNLVI